MEERNLILHSTLAIFKDKWINVILWHLDNGYNRFSDLEKVLAPISKKVLSNQLHKLEKYGLIERKVIPDKPIRVEYIVTPLGNGPKPIFDDIRKWEENYCTTFNIKDDYSSAHRIISQIIGKKWKGPIIFVLGYDTKRFGELKKELHPISQKMLTQQLREMEEHNLLKRVVFDETPPKVEYSLTEVGCKLVPIIQDMYNWGIAYHTFTKNGTQL